MGPEKHVVFEKIVSPELFPKLPNVTAIQELWDDFQQLNSVLHLKCVSTEEAEEFNQNVKKWVRKFTNIYQSKKHYPIHTYYGHAHSRLFNQIQKPCHIYTARNGKVE